MADIEEAAEAAVELIDRGKAAWESDRLLQLAGEAIIGQIANAANRLPEEFRNRIPNIAWEDIRGIRILVDHIYHRIDYQALWKTLEHDVPQLVRELRRF